MNKWANVFQIITDDQEKPEKCHMLEQLSLQKEYRNSIQERWISQGNKEAAFKSESYVNR